IARERPQRKKFRIAVIAKIKHARKTGRGITRLTPETVLPLPAEQIIDAAGNSRVIDLSRRHQAQKSPGSLRGRARGRLVSAVIKLVARAILAPAAVRVLNLEEPADRLAEFRRGVIDAGHIERAQHRPGAINVIHAPAAVPAYIG